MAGKQNRKREAMKLEPEWNPRSLGSNLRVMLYDHGVSHSDLQLLRARIVAISRTSVMFKSRAKRTSQADIALFFIDQLAKGRTVGTLLTMTKGKVLDETPAVVAIYVKPDGQPTGKTGELLD